MSEQPPNGPHQGNQGWIPPQPGYGYGYPVAAPPTPGSATAALVLGIVGLMGCGLFTALPAIFLGRTAMKEIDASQGRLGGRSTANAGYILGIVGTAISVLGLILVVAVFIFGATVFSSLECTFNESSDTASFHCD